MPQYSVADSLLNNLISNGFAWRYEFSQALAAGATVRIGLTTGAQGAMIADRTFSSGGVETIFTLHRATTWTGGAPGTLFNRNDRFWGDSVRNPLTALSTGVTATPSAANLMGTISLRAAPGPNVVSINSESANIVLAPNSNYVVSITNNDSGSQTPQMSLILFQDRASTGIIQWP